MKVGDLIDERTKRMLDDYVRNERQIAEMFRAATAMHRTMSVAQLRLPTLESVTRDLGEQLTTIRSAQATAKLLAGPMTADILRGQIPSIMEQSNLAAAAAHQLSAAMLTDITASSLKDLSASLSPDFSDLARDFFTTAIRLTDTVATDDDQATEPENPAADQLSAALVILVIVVTVTSSLIAASRPGNREQLEAATEVLAALAKYLHEHPMIFGMGGFAGLTALSATRRQARRTRS